MKLFKYEGYQLTISEEAMLLKPFKVIWKRDKTRDKNVAMQELGYIYFMEDPRSDYQTFVDRDERARQIKIGQGMKESWKPDKAVVEAQEFYASFKTSSALLAEDVRFAIDKFRSHIKELDLEATDDKGKPLYTLNSYVDALNKIPKLVVALDEAEKAIARDIAQTEQVRGSAEKAMLEDDD